MPFHPFKEKETMSGWNNMKAEQNLFFFFNELSAEKEQCWEIDSII